MSEVTWLKEGRTVQVGPGQITAADILEYAEMLIETEGWNPGPMKQGHGESSVEVGWTLHDSIGEANRRLFPEDLGGGGKEGITLSKTGAGETTRQLATAAVADAMPKKYGGDDKKFNDEAKSAQDVLDLLAKARKAVAGS